jgi:molecular chaperone GrpE
MEQEEIFEKEKQEELIEESPKFYTQDEVDLIRIQGEDKHLRLLAEFENYKKRVYKEKEDLKMSTKTQMLSTILDMDSDLALAKKNIKEENEGLNLILSKFDNFLKSLGVESIQTETYDSDLHEVISVIEIGEEKIVDVISKGYTIGGKPFRYPKIILGK